VRRQFNQNLLPKEPPPKHKNYQRHIDGSPFNKWFRNAIDQLGLTVYEFARVSGYPDATIRRWRKIGDPRKHNQKRLARILADLDLGERDKIEATIMRLCDDTRRVFKK
tara:strand:+ start:1398 stop:1724 length:327 start_codon:yes stop_codon:yes gene_type:complete